MKKWLQFMYLSWVNEFITLERYAEYYAISKETAERIIQLGRRVQTKAAVKQRLNNL